MSIRRLLRDLAMFERAFDDWGQLLCLTELARRANEEGYRRQAVRACRHALALAVDDDARGAIYGRLGEILLASHHPRFAAAAYGRAADCFATRGPSPSAVRATLARAVAERLFDAAGARQRLLALSRSLGSTRLPERARLLRETWLLLGDLDAREGRADHALTCADFAARLALTPGDGDDDGRLASLRGRALALLGRSDEATSELARADRILAARPTARLERAGVLESLALLALDSGESATSRRHLFAAIAIAEEADDEERVTRLEMLLASTWIGENQAEATRHALVAAHRLSSLVAPPDELVHLLHELCALVPSPALAAALARCFPSPPRPSA